MYNFGPSMGMLRKQPNMFRNQQPGQQGQIGTNPVNGITPGNMHSGIVPYPTRPPITPDMNMGTPGMGVKSPDIMGPGGDMSTMPVASPSPRMDFGPMPGFSGDMKQPIMSGVQPWSPRFGGTPTNIGPMQKPMPMWQRYNSFNRGMMQ